MYRHLLILDSDREMASGKKEADDGTTKTLADFTRFGAYSIFFLIAYEIMLLPEAINLLFMVYGGFAPRVVGCGQNDFRNMTTTDACATLVEIRNLTKCIPQLETQFDSLAFEFGYYCDGMLMIKQSISLLIFAALLGSMLFGQLSDAFGRRRMLLVAHAGIFLFNLIASQTNSLTEFTTLQFGAMFFAGGHSAIMHVFLMENCAKRHRLWVSCLLNYSINYILLSILSYWAADWRTLLRIASFLNIPAFCILMIAFESPRWLMQKHKIEKCRFVLRRIELINGTATSARLNQLDGLIKRELELSETQSRKRHYYFYHLFHNLKTSIHVIVISYALVTTSVIAYATIFNLEYLSGSVYVNTGVYGFCRYCINISVGVLDYKCKKIGRKHLQNTFLIFILIILSMIIVSKIIGLTNPFIVRIGILAAAGLGSQLYMLNAVVISELFPTAIRNVAASFITLFSRLGGVLAPYLFYLATYWDPFPFVIMAAFVFVNICLFNAFIPETKGRHLTDHLERKQRSFGLTASRPLIMKTTQNGTTKLTDPVKNAMSTTDPNDDNLPDPLTAKMVINSDETKAENLGDHLRAGRYIVWFCFAYEAFFW
ncbi:MFS domain-containing protein [Aphelenchoides besseyi]|nr:MFS domain-containing protein [Aphelenchoides besseyi]